jgi:hypothetical protein
VSENKVQIGLWAGQLLALGGVALKVYGTFRAYTFITTAFSVIRSGVVLTSVSVLKLGLSFVSASASAISFVIRAALGIGGLVTSLGSAILAQLGLNVAMTANPIGLIIVGVAVLSAAFYGLFKFIDNAFPNFFSTVKEWFGKAFDFVYNIFIKPIKDFFDFIFNSTDQTNQALQAAGAKTGKSEDEMSKYLLDKPNATAFDFAKFKVGAKESPDLGIGKKGKGTDVGGNHLKNINVNIQKLVEKIEIRIEKGGTEGYEKVKEMVTRALIDATNDFQYQ